MQQKAENFIVRLASGELVSIGVSILVDDCDTEAKAIIDRILGSAGIEIAAIGSIEHSHVSMFPPVASNN